MIWDIEFDENATWNCNENKVKKQVIALRITRSEESRKKELKASSQQSPRTESPLEIVDEVHLLNHHKQVQGKMEMEMNMKMYNKQNNN